MHNHRGLCKKDTDASQVDEGQEARSEFFIADGDSAELLEFEEEGFHKMAFLVKVPIDIPGVGVIRLGRDAEVRIMVSDKLAELPLAIGLVRKDSRPFQVNSAEQFFSDSDVTSIASCQHDLNRVAQSVHDSVNLGASAATAHPNALIDLGFRPDSILFWGGAFYGISGF